MNKRAFLELIISTNANPSVRQLMSVGVSEGNAIEMIMGLSTKSSDAIVRSAKELLEREEKRNALVDIFNKNTLPPITVK